MEKALTDKLTQSVYIVLSYFHTQESTTNTHLGMLFGWRQSQETHYRFDFPTLIIHLRG